VRGCDVVAVRGEEPPVIVELKRVFGLSLVLQGVDRLALSDRVYLAVGQWPKQMKNVKKLCRRLGLGLLVVARERADVVLDPAPYKPRSQQAQGRPSARRASPPRRRSQPRRQRHARALDDGLSPGGAALRGGAAGQQRTHEARRRARRCRRAACGQHPARRLLWLVRACRA
jgi:hypothetical protein